MKKSTRNLSLAILVFLFSFLLIGCGAEKQITPVDSDEPLKSIDVARYFDNKYILLSKITDLDEDSDPDKLLGRPGQYSSKTTFEIDEHICNIEVFDKQSDLSDRKKEIEKNSDKQYVYSNKNILVYLPYDVTPSDAEKIGKKLSEISSEKKEEFSKEQAKGYGVNIEDFDKRVDNLSSALNDEEAIFSIERDEPEESDGDFSRIDTYTLEYISDDEDYLDSTKYILAFMKYNADNDIISISASIPEVGLTSESSKYIENTYYSPFCFLMLFGLNPDADADTVSNTATEIATNYNKERFEMEYEKYKIWSTYNADSHRTGVYFQLKDSE